MISRFLFNISFNDNIKNIFKLLSFREKNEHSDLEKKLSIIFNNSEFYFFDYGRTAFYEILNQIKKTQFQFHVAIFSMLGVK